MRDGVAYIGGHDRWPRGGGFIYTNKDSLSVGMVVGLKDIGKATKSVDDMLLLSQTIQESHHY